MAEQEIERREKITNFSEKRERGRFCCKRKGEEKKLAFLKLDKEKKIRARYVIK